MRLFDPRVSLDTIRTVVSLIRARGHRCDYVDMMSEFDDHRGWYMTCNYIFTQYPFSYEAVCGR